jgi:hypothetical protein
VHEPSRCGSISGDRHTVSLVPSRLGPDPHPGRLT